MSKAIPSFLLQANTTGTTSQRAGKNRISFIDKTLKNVGNTVKTMYIHSESVSAKSFLFRINPLVKVFLFIYLIVIISIANKIYSQLTASVFILIFYFISGIPFSYVYKKIFFLSMVFGLFIFLPALLNVITPGKEVIRIFTIGKAYHFWIYSVPSTLYITDSGIRVVSLLFLRVLNSISLAMLFVYSSSFPQLIKGFKVFFIPDTFLMILSLTYKYIFILSKTIEETYFALKSRLFGDVKAEKIRKIVSGRIFFIFKKSKSNYEYTYNAMLSRGYNGKVLLHKEKQIKRLDVYFLITMIIVGAFILFITMGL